MLLKNRKKIVVVFRLLHENFEAQLKKFEKSQTAHKIKVQKVLNESFKTFQKIFVNIRNHTNFSRHANKVVCPLVCIKYPVHRKWILKFW